MSKFKVRTKKRKSLLSSELLRYYDDFANFNEDCAFLCDAFACVTKNHETINQNSLVGFERNANWLKKRCNELNEKLNKIRELELAEYS